MREDAAPDDGVVWGAQLEEEELAGLKALKVESEGAQKLTSFRSGIRRRRLNQSSSVTATIRLMLGALAIPPLYVKLPVDGKL